MGHINEIIPNELENRMKKENDLVVIDVREDEEVAQGMIDNAKHIPLAKIPELKDDLDQSKHYVFVCRSGRRSMKAASFMDEQGYRVSNMAGGMLKWEGEVVV
ncbi:rhodanese-like domain-containing protein [Virgibacillus sp. NKC19-3]|uniref:rhodanese-like domain-containing protein n=1 Tax=Virgibacillus saliphilus TaxID=2831674 RepID=UPI001C9A3B4F|nr:rhodanese-like domain-containing protein [Virgibacillus sp. NKC19-3]MBY7143918.1 rhodanese-like domain-containing protein [Virgibacillus sp. NKC19-3]